MNKEIPFFNWSFKKLLSTADSSFSRAKLSILFVIVSFSIIKILIVIGIAGYHHQDFQLLRASILLVAYTVLMKFLLANARNLIPITHIMLWLGVLIIWSTIFISAQSINIVVVQFVFMLMLSSYYLLNRTWGLVYSLMGSAPVILFLLFKNSGMVIGDSTDELAYPGGLILIILNFITIGLSHYLYHKAFSRNIEEKIELNVKLEAAVKEARKNAQSKSDFLSIMSHELRTPLNSVIGMTDLLLDEPDEKNRIENLKNLKFSALSLHTLINDILDFNKLDSNKLNLELISVNLDELVGNICAGLDYQAKEKGLDLQIRIDEKISTRNIISDPTRLSQIIYNLVGNGIKFTNKGFVRVDLSLVEETGNSWKVHFSVLDTGIGIDKEEHTDIFNPFIQASSSTTRKFGGTGLGLSIVKRLLNIFGSEIMLKSKPDEGSEFYFDIEFQLDSEIRKQGESVDDGIQDLKGLRLLVAEDNTLNIFLIRKLCMKWNIEPVIAEDGLAVLEKVKTQDFDVILMDIHMPEMNGFDATRQIRKMSDPKKSNIPIIALTAAVSHGLADKIQEAGMNDSLSKPFDQRELYKKLERYFK